jgi:putative flippase GtrA
VTLLLAASASAFLIAPSVHHRVLFHQKRKSEFVRLASRLALLGMALLAAAITAAVALIATFVYSNGIAIALTVATAMVFGTTWFVLPLWLRERS